MIHQSIQQKEAHKVFVLVKNTSGATLAANVPVYFETDTVSDGLAVSQCVASGGLLFAGINDASLADDGTGYIQVYGVRDSAVMLAGTSAVSYAPGQQLIASAGNNYLSPFSATTSANASPQNFVTLMETIASAAANSNTTNNAKVFIRAL